MAYGSIEIITFSNKCHLNMEYDSEGIKISRRKGICHLVNRAIFSDTPLPACFRKGI